MNRNLDFAAILLARVTQNGSSMFVNVNLQKIAMLKFMILRRLLARILSAQFQLPGLY